MLDVRVSQATGTAERDAAAEMLSHKPASKRATVGGDRGYDTRIRQAGAGDESDTARRQNTSNRSSAVDGGTTRHDGYAVSQRKRKRVEEVFGWVKTVARQCKTRFRGLDRTGWMYSRTAAYNLVRMRTIQLAAT